MSDLPDIEKLLGLQRPPIAVGFLDSIPSDIPPWSGGPVPSGCTFWQKAQQGETFYTVLEDHYNCAVGAYTHKISLPAERAAELEQTLGFMAANHYVAMEEVPGIPALAKTPQAIAYGPICQVSFIPDVVIVAAEPSKAMLLYEASLKAGASGALMNVLGRPGCAILPLALQSGAAAISLGCKGNRTYTGLPDNEMYVSIPGSKWEEVVNQVAGVLAANLAIENYHTQRKEAFQAS